MIELVSIANVEWLFLFFDGSVCRRVVPTREIRLTFFVPGPLEISRRLGYNSGTLETFRVKNNSASNIREEFLRESEQMARVSYNADSFSQE